jgi:hypothetical protein
MSAKKSDEAIPLKALEMAIVMVNAADQCDQAGQWDRDHRRACRHILDWYNSNDYKITCDKAGVKDAPPKTNADRIRQMTDEELADFFCRISECCGNDACMLCPIFEGCAQNVMCVERWLKQEVKDDDA